MYQASNTESHMVGLTKVCPSCIATVCTACGDTHSMTLVYSYKTLMGELNN